uniref:Uncharacterized protein n=1 Tax=Anopheles epiroticus TaxID=199890 RepID=A0A182P2S3_9DIPT
MQFLHIDDPSEVIPIGLRLLNLFGLPRNESFKRIFWFQWVFFFVFGIIPRFLVKIDEPIAVVRVGAEIVYTMYLIVQMVALYARRQNLYQLVDMLQECLSKSYSDNVHAFIVSANGKITKSTITYSKCFMGVCISYIGMPTIATSAVIVRNMRNYTGEPEDFFDLDIRFNLLHYSLYLGAVSVLGAIGSLILCTKDVVDFSLIRTTSMLFQVTAMQIRELPPWASQTELKLVIKSHRSTLQCATKLQQALNYALLIQLTFCTAIWCLLLFYILLLASLISEGFTSKVLNVSLLLLILTYETYSYCKLGTQFTTMADEVLGELQQLAWYDQSVAMQKQINFMIQRSQKCIVLTAGKLFPVNIAQFSEIVKKSYSFYLVLKDIF